MWEEETPLNRFLHHEKKSHEAYTQRSKENRLQPRRMQLHMSGAHGHTKDLGQIVSVVERGRGQGGAKL